MVGLRTCCVLHVLTRWPFAASTSIRKLCGSCASAEKACLHYPSCFLCHVLHMLTESANDCNLTSTLSMLRDKPMHVHTHTHPPRVPFGQGSAQSCRSAGHQAPKAPSAVPRVAAGGFSARRCQAGGRSSAESGEPRLALQIWRRQKFVFLFWDSFGGKRRDRDTYPKLSFPLASLGKKANKSKKRGQPWWPGEKARQTRVPSKRDIPYDRWLRRVTPAVTCQWTKLETQWPSVAELRSSHKVHLVNTTPFGH